MISKATWLMCFKVRKTVLMIVVMALWSTVALTGLFLGRAYADAPLPFQKGYEPPKGKGRVVVVVSGRSGPGNYAYSQKTLPNKATMRFLSMVTTSHIWMRSGGEALLRGVITRSQQSPHALPGKVAVVGFSSAGVLP